jgi:C4-dicarboxylate-specific signal transduction histidine kinase
MNSSPRHRDPAHDADPSAGPRILRIAMPAAPDGAESRRVSPREMLKAVVAEVRGRHDRRLPSPLIEIDVPAAHVVHVDPAVLRRILEVLLENAVDAAAQASGGRGTPSIREVVVTSVDCGDAIEIEVADSGPDRPAHAVARGTGRAEAALAPLVERLGGTLHAINCPEGGMAYTLRLPHRRARRAAA